MEYPQYKRTNQDRIQDAIFLLLALIFTLLFVGIPVLNMAHVSLADVIDWLTKR